MDLIKAEKELMLGKTIYDMKLRVAVYSRVSKDANEQKKSLENPVNCFSEIINNSKNWTHVASYSDKSIKGKRSYKKEEFLRMIEDAKLGKIDLILTNEISSFAHNIMDSIEYARLLLDYGVGVYFISNNINSIDSTGKMQLSLMRAMIEHEMSNLAEKEKNEAKFKE